MSFHTISKNQSKKEYKQSERGAICVTDTKILRLILKSATLPHAPNFDEALDIEDWAEIRTITTSWVWIAKQVCLPALEVIKLDSCMRKIIEFYSFKGASDTRVLTIKEYKFYVASKKAT